MTEILVQNNFVLERKKDIKKGPNPSPKLHFGDSRLSGNCSLSSSLSTDQINVLGLIRGKIEETKPQPKDYFVKDAKLKGFNLPKLEID